MFARQLKGVVFYTDEQLPSPGNKSCAAELQPAYTCAHAALACRLADAN